MRPSNNDAPRRKGKQLFEPGNRFGKGRAAGSRNAASIALDEITAGEAEGVLRAVLKQALDGDLKAAEIILARIWPVRRGRPVRLSLPAVDTAAGVDAALGTIIEGVAAGGISPEEAGAVAALLDAKCRTIAARGLGDAAQRPPVSFNIQFVTPAAPGQAAEISNTAPRAIPGSNVAVLGSRKE